MSTFRIELGLDTEGKRVGDPKHIYLPLGVARLQGLCDEPIPASSHFFLTGGDVEFWIYDITKWITGRTEHQEEPTECPGELGVKFAKARQQEADSPFGNIGELLVRDFEYEGLKQSVSFGVEEHPAWQVVLSSPQRRLPFTNCGVFRATYILETFQNCRGAAKLQEGEVDTRWYRHDPEWIVGPGSGDGDSGGDCPDEPDQESPRSW